MPVGGFPTLDRPQSGVFNEVAANAIGKEVDLTVVHFRYWKTGRALKTIRHKENYTYICICIPTIPLLHLKWSSFHFISYAYFINILLSKELNEANIVHCVQGEVGIWFSKVKERYRFKLLVQFIGTDLLSELKVHRGKPWIKNWIDDIDGATFNSQMLQTTFQGYYPAFEKIRRVIYRGCDLTLYCPAVRNFDREMYRFFYLGGLPNYKIGEGRNLKGGVDLLKAWSSFGKEHPQCKLIFAGVDTLPEKIAEFVDTNSLHNFEAIGPLSRDKVLQNYRDADCVIIPSRQEGLPNVSYEAQACGRPVIGSKVGGIPESVVDGETGLLFEVGNIEALKEAMQTILSMDIHRRLSMAARERAEKHLDSKNFGRSYAYLYHELYVE